MDCPASTYKNNIILECSNCHYSCGNCLGPGKDNCSSCNIAERLEYDFLFSVEYLNKTGFCVCKSSFYEINGKADCFRKSYIFLK